jgi:hypothetical protein
MVKWLVENDVKTLNVAGHRESVHPGVLVYVEKYLNFVFKGLHDGECRVSQAVW